MRTRGGRVAIAALVAALVAGVAGGAVVGLAGCKQPGRDDGAARRPDAAVVLRARPAELVHVTLKVLGMT